MNGKDLLTKLGDIDQSYYAEAEGEGTSSAASPRILRKPLLVAALIAAAILLMGCAIAYKGHDAAGKADHHRQVF